MTFLRILGVVTVAILTIAYSSIFVVDERQKALVLQFGQIKAVKEMPKLQENMFRNFMEIIKILLHKKKFKNRMIFSTSKTLKALV